MPKNKRPVPRKNSTPPEDKEETLSAALCALALELSEQEDSDALGVELHQKQNDFLRLVRKYVQQQKDELLYTAIDHARYEDVDGYRMLKGAIEEAASTVHLRRDSAPDMEINAFAIPIFVHSTGGLKAEQEFLDDAAYDALLASFTSAGLEAPKARVVLLRHAYDQGEASAITYCQLNTMVREAAASMTEKKLSAAPALERSMSGWNGPAFGAADAAVELRFLLGFALKRADDPFYQAPEDEAAQDDYYATRMERYRQWTVDAAPLVQRCLAGARNDVQLSFQYQDLFFSACEQALAEHAMLDLIAQLGAALRSHDGPARAVIAPADVRGDMVLRVKLYPQSPAGGDTVLASADKPIDLGCDLQLEVDDVADALASIGIDAAAISVAARYDAQGKPQAPQPLQA